MVTFGGTDYRSGERYVSYESVKGGFGARPVKDGINAVASTISNMMNTPIEILEMSFPLRVEEYSLVPDSGGAGTWRGGLGVRRVINLSLADESHEFPCHNEAGAVKSAKNMNFSRGLLTLNTVLGTLRRFHESALRVRIVRGAVTT